MQRFVQWFERKHDLGIICDPETGISLGSAMCCGPSSKHPNSVSINTKELKVARQCFSYLVLRFGDREKIIPMEEACRLIDNYGRRTGDGTDFVVLNWSDVNNTSESDKLPF
jgi:hypothetical protein